MDFIVKVLFAILIFTYTWLFQEQNQEWDLERQLLKSADNLATHDAVQWTHRDSANGGKLIVDEQQAYDTFLSTLRANLGLDENLQPNPESPILSEVKVVYFRVIDERTVTFPYLYDDPVYHVAKYLRGPAVVAVIETLHPTLVRWTFDQQPIRVPAISEYVSKNSD